MAYSAPHRHGFLKVVENNYCASRRGILSLLKIFYSAFHICVLYSFLFNARLYLLRFMYNSISSAINYNVSTFVKLQSCLSL